MIDDLDRTITQLLAKELAPDLLAQVAITFATPDEDFPPSMVNLPALSFFLYDIRENRDLRRSGWDVEVAANGELQRERPPVRLDCSYLVTAWPSAASTTPPLDEHRLLGAAITALLRHSVLPKSSLQGSLAQAALPVPTATLQQGHLDDVANFWQALGGRPRAAFGYTVTVSVQPFAPQAAGKPVIKKELRFKVGKDLEQLHPAKP
jgi:hypothetical protein